MAHSADQLINLEKRNEFLVGIDSDGCVFDTMEIKHKECFIPNIVNYWELQAVSKYAREAAEFVNLYSKWRGINRFPGLVLALDLLGGRPEAMKRGYRAPGIARLRRWIDEETRLGNPALEKLVREENDPALAQALAWSKAVNEAVAKIVRGIPPFPYARECLKKIELAADAIVVSGTPGEALRREWEESGITGHGRVIAGQEMGSKAECLGHAMKGRYDGSHVLMVGDAPGDLKAARANGALFYPVNPGDEERSWERFYNEALGLFFAGKYTEAYERQLIDEFDKRLPSEPPWAKESSK
jgi:phosphoglycolate phosphatase-like HAD superfamily hydrolase